MQQTVNTEIIITIRDNYMLQIKLDTAIKLAT